MREALVRTALVRWWVLSLGLIGALFVSLFLIEGITQEPILMPLHFWCQLGGFWWFEPFGGGIGVLGILLGSLVDAALDDFCSGGNPICQFQGGCFMQQCVRISREDVMISGQAIGFEFN